jgi:hypothetical protein
LKGEHAANKRVGKSWPFRPTLRRFRPAPWIADYWQE